MNETQAMLLTSLKEREGSLFAARSGAALPARGWLRALREALGLAQGRVAKKLGVTRQSYAQFEESERKGTISLSSLRRAAGAMDCELVYFLVPRESPSSGYADLARENDPSARHMSATDHSMALEREGDAGL